VLGEAAIRQNIGGRQIMTDRPRYLLELEKFPNVELLAVPFSANWTPALTGSYMLLDDDTPGTPSQRADSAGPRLRCQL
jgi:hypothetical protein